MDLAGHGLLRERPRLEPRNVLTGLRRWKGPALAQAVPSLTLGRMALLTQKCCLLAELRACISTFFDMLGELVLVHAVSITRPFQASLAADCDSIRLLQVITRLLARGQMGPLHRYSLLATPLAPLLQKFSER